LRKKSIFSSPTKQKQSEEKAPTDDATLSPFAFFSARDNDDDDDVRTPIVGILRLTHRSSSAGDVFYKHKL
jgi:hypothetical protein